MAPRSPRESYQTDGSKATRIFRVPWYKREAFITRVLGWPKKPTEGPLERFLPDCYRPPTSIRGTDFGKFGYNNDGFRYATRIADVQPIPKAGQGNDVTPEDIEDALEGGYDTVPLHGRPYVDLNTENATSGHNSPVFAETVRWYPVYHEAEITVEYETLPYDVLDEGTLDRLRQSYSAISGTNPDTSTRPEWLRFTTVRPDPSAEMVTIPPGYLYYADADPAKRDVIPHGLPYSERYLDLVLIWHGVPYVPDDVFDYLNCCNQFDNTFYGWEWRRRLGFPAETLLLLDIDWIPQRSAMGVRVWDIIYRLRYKKGGWNGHRRYQQGPPPTLDYKRFSVSGSEEKTDENLVYPLRNLHDLFAL